MNLSAYFERIGYTGSTEPTLANLKAIHRAHMMNIPFENLNIHIPRQIVLTEKALFAKIVHENRGGFCFEQNGLFSAVLRELGYEVYKLEGNVYSHERGGYGEIRRGHMTLMVIIDGVRYLADVGFGAGFVEPIELDNPDIQKQDVGSFRIEHDGKKGFFYQQQNGDEEMKLAYRFFIETYELSDYEEACHYVQTSPKTHFTQKRVCTKLIADGRITLTDGKFIHTALDGQRTETDVESESQFHDLLKEHFGIDVQTRVPQILQS